MRTYRGDFQLSALEQVIATALLNKALYGVEIANTINTASGGSRPISTNSLYSALKRMKESGIIQSAPPDEENRVFYSLTPRGREAITRVLELYAKLQA